MHILGTTLMLEDPTVNEVQHRVNAGWKMFHALRSMLLRKASSQRKRLRLFDSTVGSCVLWCAQSWSLRSEEVSLLQKTQRTMLRKVVPFARRDDEDYVEWIRDATRRAERAGRNAGVRMWSESHYHSKWSWAGRVARQPWNIWHRRVALWRDSDWQTTVDELGQWRPFRPSRRRWTKWEDPLRRFASAEGYSSWSNLAQDRESWRSLTDKFANRNAK